MDPPLLFDLDDIPGNGWRIGTIPATFPPRNWVHLTSSRMEFKLKKVYFKK
jgi:hypothetical protein